MLISYVWIRVAIGPTGNIPLSKHSVSIIFEVEELNHNSSEHVKVHSVIVQCTFTSCQHNTDLHNLQVPWKSECLHSRPIARISRRKVTWMSKVFACIIA